MKKELVHPELSYKVTGLLFAVHNELGRYRNEKQYGDSIERYLKEFGIAYERERVLPPSFAGEKERRNKIDFVVANTIVLEIKAKRLLTKDDYFQIMRYLEGSKKRLGMLVNFRQKYLTPRRVLRGYEEQTYS